MAHGVVHHVGCPAANGTPSTRLAARSVRAAHNRTFTRTCTHATARTHTHTAAHDGDTETRTHMHALSRCKGSCMMCLASAGEAASRASDASCTFADARRFGHGAAVVKHPQTAARAPTLSIAHMNSTTPNNDTRAGGATSLTAHEATTTRADVKRRGFGRAL